VTRSSGRALRGMVLALALMAARGVRADPIPAGQLAVGLNLEGGLGLKNAGTLLPTVLGGYAVYKGIIVGVLGSYGLVGIPLWRTGAFGEIYLGPDSIRPYAQIRLEGIGVGRDATFAVGFSFGLSFQFTQHFLLNATFGFDGNVKTVGESYGIAGIGARYVF